jgi:hypothetical protein
MRDAGGGVFAKTTASERGDSNMGTVPTSDPDGTSPQGISNYQGPAFGRLAMLKTGGKTL